MAGQNGFEEVLDLFETHGWKLKIIVQHSRVFVKEGEPPWLIPVHNKKVDAEYVKRFKDFLQGRGEI